MRKFVLIAAMVLTSAAAAQAGESRGLSTQGDTTATTYQPRYKDVRAENDTAVTPPADTPRYSAPADDPQRSVTDTPRYTARPEPVAPTPTATTATAAPPTTTASADPSSGERTYHRSPRSRQAGMGGMWMPYRYHMHRRLTLGRVVAALHHYGIYW
jgi:hypothetical protein